LSSARENYDRVADLVAAYGGDLERWPASERHRVDALDAAQRKQLLGEARAFDRLIMSAVAKEDQCSASDELMARILTSLPTEHHETARANSDTGMVMPDGRSGSRNAQSRRHRRSAYQETIAAASLLAASLVIGFFIGSTDLGRTTTVQLGDLAGLSPDITEMQTTALDDVLPFQDDEDIL